MPRTPLRLVLAACAVAVVLAGCGTSSGDAADEPTTTKAEGTTTSPTETTATADTTEPDEPTETSVPAGDDICVPLKVLSDYDIESARLIAVGDWAAIQAYFIEETDPVLAAYDDAIAMDSEVTDDLEELRAISEGTADMASSATSLADLSDQLLALPGITSAGEAGLRLNEFAEQNCGFSTGANG